MARRVKSSDLESREARRKLKVRGKPYWKAIGPKLHVGYRKNKGGGVWVARRYLGNQVYKVETVAIADDSEDANNDTVLNFWQAQDRARTLRNTPSVGTYTVDLALTDYLAHLEGRPTHYDLKKRLGAYVGADLRKLAVADLQAEDISKWHKAIARMQLRRGRVDLGDEECVRRRQATANTTLAVLKAALNYAVANDKVACVPTWNKVKAFKGVHVPRDRYLTPAECRRLIDACEASFGILVQAGLHTGARFSNLNRLRAADFNADAGTLTMRRSKSGKPYHVHLTAEGVEFFRARAAELPDCLVGRPWGRQKQNRAWAEACERADIRDACFHSLRHTWASLSIMAGMSLIVVARNLGHTDTRMVERVYGHLAPSYMSDEIRRHAPRFEVSS